MASRSGSARRRWGSSASASDGVRRRRASNRDQRAYTIVRRRRDTVMPGMRGTSASATIGVGRREDRRDAVHGVLRHGRRAPRRRRGDLFRRAEVGARGRIRDGSGGWRALVKAFARVAVVLSFVVVPIGCAGVLGIDGDVTSAGADGAAASVIANADGSANADTDTDGSVSADGGVMANDANILDAGTDAPPQLCDGGPVYTHTAGLDTFDYPGDAGGADWTDCVPLGTYNQEQAMKACVAWATPRLRVRCSLGRLLRRDRAVPDWLR